MPVSFAVAIALFMRRVRGKSRLQAYQEKLHQQQPSQGVLYELPIKKVLMAGFILGVIMLLGWLAHHIPLEFQAAKKSTTWQKVVPLAAGQEEQLTVKEEIDMLERTETVIRVLRGFLGIVVALMVLDCSVARVKFDGKKRMIERVAIGRLGWWTEKSQWRLQENDRLVIKKKGSDRFTNYDEHYIVELHQKKVTSTLLLRGDLFTARKSVIHLNAVLKIKFSTVVKTDPTETR